MYLLIQTPITLAQHVRNQFVGGSFNGVFIHNPSIAYSANDGSYRYSGPDPSNYVCFGSDANPCPDDNLYRIIGAFGDNVKLIKVVSLGQHPWMGTTADVYPDWANSALNINVLNGQFLNSFTPYWSEKIAAYPFFISRNNGYNFMYNGAQVAFDFEVGLNKNPGFYVTKICLMYVSDYYYGAMPEYWSYPGYSDDGRDYRQASVVNWMPRGAWTISRITDSDRYVINVDFGGVVSGPVANSFYLIFPVFYLNPVYYISGVGTSANPFRIS